MATEACHENLDAADDEKNITFKLSTSERKIILDLIPADQLIWSNK